MEGLHSDIIDSLRSYLLGSSAEQNIFTSEESVLSCVDLLDVFADKAIQAKNDLWPGVDFEDKSEIYADMTKAYKTMRIAFIFETIVEVGVSPEAPDKFAPQRRQPAKNARIDVGKTLETAAAKVLSVKFRSSRTDGSGDCS